VAIRVAIVAEHPVERRGLTSILGAQPDIEVVAAVAEPASLPADAVGAVTICDPYPFGEAARLDAVRDLAARGPVLAVSGSGDPTDVTAAIRAGALGYVTKDNGAEAYVAAVRSVSEGRVHLAPRAVEALRPGTAPTHGALSWRERQALSYIARGFTHQQAARRMGVSKATVDTYVARVRTKLRVGNKAELALAALRYVGSDHAAG
jgi:DNA-binding NarL/FixJ family response regulator